MKKLLLAAAVLGAAGIMTAGEVLPKIEDVDKYMTIKTPDESGLVWYKPDVAEDAPFKLIGFYWYGKDHIYNRLPQGIDLPLTDELKYLSRHTAGGQVRFRTNSKRVVVRAKTSGFGVMNHMAQTGSGGFDLYAGDGTDQVFWRTTIYPTGETNINSLLFN